MAVSVGETAADYLAVNFGYGLTATSLFMTTILIVALVLQFRQKRHVSWAYWLAVVLISVVGTLITDNLIDNFGARLETTTIAFSKAKSASGQRELVPPPAPGMPKCATCPSVGTLIEASSFEASERCLVLGSAG